MLRLNPFALRSFWPNTGTTADSTNAAVRVGALGGVVFQFVLLVVVIRQFSLESAAFFSVCVLALAGFVVHSLIPFRYRLPFFTVLSIAAIGLVLGPGPGGLLIAVGAFLIGVCHLPVSLRARVGMIALVGIVLAALRSRWVDAPISAAIWPILGSMFMFRLVIYLYDLGHSKDRPRPAQALSYFFLLPNVCFPLFPVVDYQTFTRTYYNEDASRIYQRGIDWMFRGVTHLIAYRFLYHYVAITPAEVTNVPQLLQYLVGEFGLYVRISGQFHLIVGMLLLFGFNLPLTNNLYFLANGFTDLWRRINIYWKDFMMKVFYYPAVFRLVPLGTTAAVALATLYVFVVTWALHSYQWFWLRGSLLLEWKDVVFWTILAVLVVTASVREAKRGRRRTLGPAAPPTWSARLATAGRTAATFATMCVLWSMWFCESFPEWLAMWPAAVRGGFPLDSASRPAVMFVGSVAIGIAAAAIGMRMVKPLGILPPLAQQPMVRTTSLILAVYALGQPLVHTQLGAEGSTMIAAMRSDNLNARDGAKLEKSYYEGLVRVDRFNSELFELYMKNPIEVNEWGEVGRTVQFTDDFRMKELRPNFRTSLKNRSFSTNYWGLRDRDYEQRPSQGTLRIALLGSSVVMGSGVADGENFESLLEERLNRDHGSSRERYEILNFAVGGYGPLEQLVVLDKKVISLHPNVMLYIAHDSDEQRAVAHLARAVFRGIGIPYPELQRLGAAAAGSPSEAAAEARLRAAGPEIVLSSYHYLASRSRENGMRPVWVFLPAVHENRNRIGTLGTAAQDAGFEVFDLSNVFESADLSQLRISNVDHHPNPRGHRVLAEKLYQSLWQPVLSPATRPAFSRR